MIETSDFKIVIDNIINELVSRNSLKFPDRFCFKIGKNGYAFLKSQIETSKRKSKIRNLHEKIRGDNYCSYFFESVR